MSAVKAWMPLALLFGAVWLLAFFSMRAGNPTAINAVVGIPFGAAIGGAIIWGATRST